MSGMRDEDVWHLTSMIGRALGGLIAERDFQAERAASAELDCEKVTADLLAVHGLLVEVWNQFSCPVAECPGASHDGGLSVLEDVAATLVNAGRLHVVMERPDREWYRRTSPEAA